MTKTQDSDNDCNEVAVCLQCNFMFTDDDPPLEIVNVLTKEVTGYACHKCGHKHPLQE